MPVRQLRPEQVTTFISDLVDAGSAGRAVNIRTLLIQVLDEAVSLGPAQENVTRKVKRPRVPRTAKRTLTPAEVSRLLDACDERFVAAVALCYVQGWRVSEALGPGRGAERGSGGPPVHPGWSEPVVGGRAHRPDEASTMGTSCT